MRDFLAALSSSEVEVNGTTYRVSPPTTRQALYVLAAMEALGVDDDAWNVLEEACKAWLPAGLADLYFGKDCVPHATVRDLSELIAIGVRDRDKFEQNKQEVQAEAKRRSWFAVVADYCDALNTDPDRALDAPFPMFLGFAVEVFRIGQRRKADFMIAYAVARTGDKAWHTIMRTAGYLLDEDELQSIAREWEPEPGWVEAQVAKAKRARKHKPAASYWDYKGEA